MSHVENNQQQASEEINKKHVIITVVVWGVIALFAWFLFLPKTLELKSFSPLPSPKNLSIDPEGLTFTRDFDSGSWSMIFFGFAQCPDVCPIEMSKLAQVVKAFEAEKSASVPLMIFVSVDPERDDLQTVKHYVEYFNKDALGITASNEGLGEMAKFFGAPYSRSVKIGDQEYLVEAGADMPKGAGNEYTVNHSSRIYVLNPNGQYVGSFPPPHDVDTLIADMKELMR